MKDLNYETDHRELNREHRELNREHRIKRKVQRLDSESENESDSELQDSRVKKTLPIKKSLSKLKKTVPELLVFLLHHEDLHISPYELIR